MFSFDWTTPHLANFEQCFNAVSKKGLALEIGAFEGRTTAFLAEHFGRVIAVDPHVKPTFHKAVADFPNVSLISSRLVDGVWALDESDVFDFIYVDGSHVAQDVLLDLSLAWSRLKLGGVMLIDDYEWECDAYIQELFSSEFMSGFTPERRLELFSPRAAVDGFIKANAEADVLFKGYQVALRRTRDMNRQITAGQNFFSPQG